MMMLAWKNSKSTSKAPVLVILGTIFFNCFLYAVKNVLHSLECGVHTDMRMHSGNYRQSL